MDLRNFNIREATWKSDKNCIIGLRRLVFSHSVLNQADELDKKAWHWLALDTNDRAMGYVRLTPKGSISHLLVLSEYQNQKTGKTLLECAIKKARHLELVQLNLLSPGALTPYFQKSGFKHDGTSPPGSEFQTMTAMVDSFHSISQRKSLHSSNLDIQVRNYDTAEVDGTQHRKAIQFLRHQVLVVELGLNESVTTVETASPNFHFVTRKDDQIIGAVQLEKSGRVSKLIVDSDYRRQGVASSLLESVKIKAGRLGITKITCQPTDLLVPLLKKQDFKPESGKVYNSVWTKMIKKVVVERLYSGEKNQQSLNKIILGKDNNFLLLRSKDEFQKMIVEMCQQAKQSLQILTPFFDHALFDQQNLRDICSALARKNKYTRIEILLFDPHRVIKNGHSLVELSRRLPSSMNIRIVHPEMRNSNHEYLIVDGRGYIYRQEVDLYEGCANFHDITEGNRLLRQFRRSWESSLSDPNLRQLKL